MDERGLVHELIWIHIEQSQQAFERFTISARRRQLNHGGCAHVVSQQCLDVGICRSNSAGGWINRKRRIFQDKYAITFKSKDRQAPNVRIVGIGSQLRGIGTEAGNVQRCLSEYAHIVRMVPIDVAE
jgi:hypothetical protein